MEPRRVVPIPFSSGPADRRSHYRCEVFSWGSVSPGKARHLSLKNAATRSKRLSKPIPTAPASPRRRRNSTNDRSVMATLPDLRCYRDVSAEDHTATPGAAFWGPSQRAAGASTRRCRFHGS